MSSKEVWISLRESFKILKMMNIGEFVASRKVIDLISSSQKPVVSQNYLSDFTTIHAKFFGPIPLNIMDKYGVKIDIACLDMLDTGSRQKEVHVVTKLYWGDAREKLVDAVKDLNLILLSWEAEDLVPSKELLLASDSTRTYLGKPWKKYSRTVVMQYFLS